ncbi:CamS family sex pheromone protein [Atopobacter sp. AH10]|uniref:CamS family sex pheromone protein n=1 Tax=Atopobacter sp. AH10 TaxID=2315861 RepID=UPI000EF28179|nr:CamS family sex pheromone protein [Atopobacter sp. AH10]RLK63545.1 CamS family sex pheromone protein [Atopobacter sp. AH10]
MKKYGISRVIFGLVTATLLSGCVGLEQLNDQTDHTKSNSETHVPVKTTSNQLSNDFYRALIEDGKYKPSKSRGVSLSLDSGYNINNFEIGLMDLSKKVFPTDQYFFREGQVLDSDTIKEWIGRKSKQNPDGLNPGTAEDSKNLKPYYLAQLLEQDYIVKNDNTYELAGLSIGLAMNSQYRYTKDGKEYTQEIDDETLKQQGKEMASIILQRLREIDSLKDVAIVFGIFKQAAPDDIAGGTYLSTATSTKGALISSWSSVNKKYKVFPLVGEEATQDSTQFENFRTNVENFFPNLSGVTGRACYEDGVLTELKVEIITQFYGKAEIIAFAQHCTDMASKYLKYNVPVEVRIKSINGPEALLIQNQATHSFTYHIY